MQEAMINRAKQLLADGTVNRVIGWKRGEFVYDITPAVFETAEEIDAEFIFDDFTQANVSKYLVKESKKDGKILAFLKPCDTYSFNQLVKEHRINRDNVYVIGIPGGPKLDIEKIKAKGITGILNVKNENYTLKIETLYGEETMPFSEAISGKCADCKSKKHVAYDELIGDDGDVLESNRFDMVEKLENMTAQERYDFWRGELSKCIRCNACRNVCPACTCETAYLIIRIQVFQIKQQQTALKKICSILYVLSMLPEDVQTVVNVHVFVLRIFLFICSTESLLRI